MILEAGLLKAVAAGGGLVSSVALIAGMSGGGQVASVKGDPDKLASAACSYTEPQTPKRIKQPKKVAPKGLGLTTEQLSNARTIVDTADDLGLPKRAAVVGVATALQESYLKNGVVGDNGQAHGIFQQHPQHGWGTRAQVTDPKYAARKFFSRLVKVKGWEDKPLTVAAQTVQRSAFPSAYAKHEGRAESIVKALDGSRPPASKKSSGRHDPVDLSKEDAKLVKASLEAAIALGIPRSAVIADVSAGLEGGYLPSAGKGDPAKLAAQIINDVAGGMCAELSKKIDEVLDPKTLEAIGKSGRGAVALKAALKMIGVPYSWGGGGPGGPSLGIGRGARTKGFDCSGLAEYAWSKAGVKVGGHTSTQWAAGARVSRSQLKPGDLIFFATNPRNPSTIHHVAINIDGKRYVHAPYTGSTVKVDGWTAKREAEYAGAVRPR